MVQLSAGPGSNEVRCFQTAQHIRAILLASGIDGDEVTLAHGLLLSWDIQRFTPEYWHIAMPEKTREESISSFNRMPESSPAANPGEPGGSAG